MPLPVKLSPVRFALFAVFVRHCSVLLKKAQLIVKPVRINLPETFRVQGLVCRRIGSAW